MKLSDLVEGFEILEKKGNCDIEISGICNDHRTISKGSLFVCIKGFKVNGHDFIEAAIRNGVAALIVEETGLVVPEEIPVLVTKNSREALAFVSSRFLGEPSKAFKLVGVTGTKGKTTTTYMVNRIAELAGYKTGLIGTIENRIGYQRIKAKETTPESLALQRLFRTMADEKVDFVTMEVSSQGLALGRTLCSDFDIGVFTNLYKDHIAPNEHADMNAYFAAKLKLFDTCKIGLVNKDCAAYEEIATYAKCKLFSFAIDKDADIRAREIKNIRIGNVIAEQFQVETPWFNDKITVSMPGKYNIYNALAAIGICGLCGIDPVYIKAGLESVKVRGRVEYVDAGQPFTVIVDYAHNAASLESLLQMLREYHFENIITVFGCGGDRAKDRRFEMGEVSGRLSNLTIVTSDNPRSEEQEAIMKDIETGLLPTNGNYIKIPDRKTAIETGIKMAREGDLVLIAGKGHETTQTFKDSVIHFDDVEIAFDFLKGC